MKKTLLISLSFALFMACQQEDNKTINRFDLVSRHNVIIEEVDSLNSLSIGNGDFAFTVDITGLQSFPEYYSTGVPLGTFSNWCWHSDPNEQNYNHAQTLKYFKSGGRDVGYYHDFGREQTSERAKASSFLRQNPHRLNMALVGLKVLDENGELCNLEAIKNPKQVLNLWTGEITSQFEIQGQAVIVNTVCHPENDMIACQISSPLIDSGRLFVEFRFPEADRGWKNRDGWGADESHQSQIQETSARGATISHRQDSTNYLLNINHSAGKLGASAAHSYELIPDKGSDSLSFTFAFAQQAKNIAVANGFEDLQQASFHHWEEFWLKGGAVDFSDCTDERAFELERRVILSRYLTQVNCSGSLPPQETGLTYNSWFGKFHLEMHWWHGVHFALWQKGSTLEKQMQYYRDVKEEALALADLQGYRGLRWPKMVGPDGFTSPSTVGNYLIWQQPHYIYFAELLYQTSPKKDSIIQAYQDLVFETAEFMASYPNFDSIGDRYVLGPALIPAQETFHAVSTINPTFELTYWHWALDKAIAWEKRQDREPPASWLEVKKKLSLLPVADSVYLFTEDGIDSYTNDRYISDHPAVLGSLGMLPETGLVDRPTMRRSFDKIVERWNWPSTWGWDFPLVAMAAAELDLPGQAIDFLMLDVQKNTYLPNGHNFQDGRLTLYLPGNGGLLTAVARMCTKDQFPKDGTWEVRWENLEDF